MTRRLTLMLLLLLAPACGGDAPEGPAPAPPEPPAPAVTPFSITVPATSAPGARPAILIRGGREGVTVRILRIVEPVPLLLAPEAALPYDAELVAEFPAGRRPPRLEAGLYLVETDGAPEETRARLLVTDLAVVAKRSSREILVYVADAASGLPVPSAKISLMRAGIVEGDVADARGVYRARVPPDPFRLVVEKEGRLAAVTCPEAPDPGEPGPFVLFDRPGFRPGDRLRFKSLTRPEEVRLTDRRGITLAPDRLTRASTGSAWGSFRLPRSFASGPARLTIVSGRGARDLPVTVLPAEPPSFELTAMPHARVAARGEPVGFTIRAAARDGADLAGMTVEYGVERRQPAAAEPVIEGRGALDAFGEIDGSFVPEEAGAYRIHAALPGPGSEAVATSAIVRVLPAAVALDLDTSEGFFEGEEAPFVRVRASFPLSPRVPVKGTVRAAGRSFPFEIPESGEPVAEVAVGPLDPGRYAVTAEAADPAGRPITAEVRILVGADLHREEGLLVLPERLACDPGERTRALVFLPPGFGGATLLATVEGPGLGNHEVVTANGRRAVLRFSAPRTPGRRAAIRVVAIRAGAILEGEAMIRVSARQQRLFVRLSADPTEPKPGEPVELELGAKGADGSSVPAPACVLVRSAGGPAVPDVSAHLHGDLRPAVIIASFPERAGPAEEDGEGARAGDAGGAAGVLVAGWSPHVFLPVAPPAAKVTVVLPSGPTLFEATAVAAIGDRAGSETLTIRTRAPHRILLRAPPFLTEGDVAPAEVILANEQDAALAGVLTLSADGVEVAGKSRFEVSVAPGALLRRKVALEASREGRVRLAATLAGPGLVKGRGLVVHPRGVERSVRASGILEPGRTVVPLDLPPGVSPRDARLEVELRLGTSGALAGAEDLPEDSQPAGALSLLVRDLLARGGRDGPTRPEDGDEDPLTRFADLWAHQRSDGAFARWPDGPADLRLTAVVVALGELARRAELGLDEERLARAAAALPDGATAPERPGAEDAAWAALDLARARRHWGPAELRLRRELLDADLNGPARFLVLPALAAAPALGDGQEAAIRVRAGNGIAASVALDGETPAVTVSVPPELLAPGRNPIVFESRGSTHVSWRAVLVYRVPGGATDPDLPFSIRRSVHRSDPEGSATEPLEEDAAVRRGDYLRTDVTVRAAAGERWVTVECPLPGGARAVTGVLPVPEGVRMEVREDRLVFRLPSLGAKPVVLPVLLRAAHEGRFALRPAEVYAEDAPDRRADTSSASLTIE